jgi:hypothetical protein
LEVEITKTLGKQYCGLGTGTNMNEAKNFQVIMPLGLLAGQSVPLGDALTRLALQMLGIRDGLLKLAMDPRVDKKERKSPDSRIHDPVQYLEQYATAIQSLALQLDREVWEKGEFKDFLIRASQNSITLPEWMGEEE